MDVVDETRLVQHMAKYYNYAASSYIGRSLRGESSQLGENWKAIATLLKPYEFGPYQRCLDIGTGVGFPGRFFSTRMQTIGIDVSLKMLQHYELLTQQNQVTGLLQRGLMDARCLGFKSESFDLVTCIGLFEYVANPRYFFSEVWRILKPGGLYLFNFYNKGFIAARTGGPYPRAVHLPFKIWEMLREEGFGLPNCLPIRNYRDYFQLARKRSETT